MFANKRPSILKVKTTMERHPLPLPVSAEPADSKCVASTDSYDSCWAVNDPDAVSCRRFSFIRHPATGSVVRFDLDRIPAPRPGEAVGCRGCSITTGWVGWFYVAAIFCDGACLAVLGPCHNAATALVLAREWVVALAMRQPTSDSCSTLMR